MRGGRERRYCAAAAAAAAAGGCGGDSCAASLGSVTWRGELAVPAYVGSTCILSLLVLYNYRTKL
jgi:hypothetical protein